MSFKETYLLIAMLTVFIPVGVAFFRYKYLSLVLRALMYFLAFSFLFDVKHYIVWLVPYRSYFTVTFSIFQFLFYLWFLRKTAPQMQFFKHYKVTMAAFIVLWCFCYVPLLFGHNVLWQRALFEVSQAILLSLLSAFALLDLTKSGQIVYEHVYFRFFLGIFVYFFMNMFLYAFMHASFRNSIWALHSIFDILKNLLFLLGFLMATNKTQYQKAQL